MSRGTGVRFAVRSVVVWAVMVAVLVVVPDTLESYMSLQIARVFGWVFASGIWVAVLEREWQQRFRPIPRFALQIVVWLMAALVAIWISDQFRAGRIRL